MSWASLSQNVRQREWLTVIKSYSFLTNANVTVLDRSNSLCELLPAVHGEFMDASENQVLSLPTRHSSCIVDALNLSRKSGHLTAGVRLQMTSGRCTWASTDAHHASLIAAKAICALLGLVIIEHHNRNYLVDCFPEFGAATQQKDFRKKHKSVKDPVRLLHTKANLVEQSDIWKLLNRMLRISSFGDDRDSISDVLTAFKLGDHRPMRNRLLYTINAWIYEDDLPKAYFPFKSNSAFLKAVDSIDDLRDFKIFITLWELLSGMLKDLSTSFGFPISDVHPEFKFSDDTGKHWLLVA